MKKSGVIIFLAFYIFIFDNIESRILMIKQLMNLRSNPCVKKKSRTNFDREKIKQLKQKNQMLYQS